jgi:hypothetical protein
MFPTTKTTNIDAIQMQNFMKKSANFSQVLQDSELLRFWSLSIVRYSKKTLENTTFWKLGLFPSLKELTSITGLPMSV